MGGDSNKMKERILGKLMFVLLFALLLSCCRKAAEEDLLIDDRKISLSGEESESTGAEYQSEESTDDPGPVSAVPDTFVYDIGVNILAVNSENVLYIPPSAGDRTPQLLMAADRVSGITKPLCTKPDCSHDSVNCAAYIGNAGNVLTAMAADDEWLYYAFSAAAGEKVFRRQLPDGEAEPLFSVSYTDLFPEEAEYISTVSTGRSAFYKGDFYYTACVSDTPNTADRRERVYYATAALNPIDSGREARTVVRDKVTGFDFYDIFLMPRDEGLYIIEKMIKWESRTERESNISHILATQVCVFLYHPENDFCETVYTGEFPEGEELWNLNIIDGKLYYEAYAEEEAGIRIYSRDMETGESQLLIEKEEDPETESTYECCFTKDAVILWKQQQTEGPEMKLFFEIYNYGSEKIREFAANKPAELKPQEYTAQDQVNGWTEAIGADESNLYFRDSWYSMTTGYRFIAAYAVSLDGLRVTPFAVDK